MLLKIDFESDIPIYIQLKNQLVEGMATGSLPPGYSLPSVRQLAEDIGINMHTVNKTYALLKNDGLIILDRRKGAIVSSAAIYDDQYIKKLKEEIAPYAAEAYCKGLNQEQFLNICKDIFGSYGSPAENMDKSKGGSI